MFPPNSDVLVTTIAECRTGIREPAPIKHTKQQKNQNSNLIKKKNTTYHVPIRRKYNYSFNDFHLRKAAIEINQAPHTTQLVISSIPPLTIGHAIMSPKAMGTMTPTTTSVTITTTTPVTTVTSSEMNCGVQISSSQCATSSTTNITDTNIFTDVHRPELLQNCNNRNSSNYLNIIGSQTGNTVTTSAPMNYVAAIGAGYYSTINAHQPLHTGHTLHNHSPLSQHQTRSQPIQQHFHFPFPNYNINSYHNRNTPNNVKRNSNTHRQRRNGICNNNNNTEQKYGAASSNNMSDTNNLNMVIVSNSNLVATTSNTVIPSNTNLVVSSSNMVLASNYDFASASKDNNTQMQNHEIISSESLPLDTSRRSPPLLSMPDVHTESVVSSFGGADIRSNVIPSILSIDSRGLATSNYRPLEYDSDTPHAHYRADYTTMRTSHSPQYSLSDNISPLHPNGINGEDMYGRSTIGFHNMFNSNLPNYGYSTNNLVPPYSIDAGHQPRYSGRNSPQGNTSRGGVRRNVNSQGMNNRPPNPTDSTNFYTPPDRFLARSHLVELRVAPDTLRNGSKWDRLSQMIWDKVVAAQQTEDTYKKKMYLWRHLYICFKYGLQKTYPRYSIYLVGSTISGFGSDSSDVDMCVVSRISTDLDHRQEAVIHLTHLKEYLTSTSGIFEAFNLIQAKVPILRFKDSLHLLEVDLNYNNSVGIRNTHLLYCYSKMDWRVRPLALVVKLWAQFHHINNAKDMTISSYSLVLMTIHFLQRGIHPEVLPCLHSMYPHKFQSTTDINAIDMHEELDAYHSNNNLSLGELFLEFLRYYSEFDYAQFAISIRTANIIPIEQCRQAKSAKNDPHQWKELCIEEPFDFTNTARSVYDGFVFKQIKNVFRMSLERLQESLDLNSIFTTPFLPLCSAAELS